MSLARSFVAFGLVLVPWFAACGSEEPAVPSATAGASLASFAEDKAGEVDDASERAATNVQGRIAKLIPADTAIYVQLKTLTRLDALLARLSRSNPSSGRSIDELGRLLHRQIPGDGRHIRRDQPIGIAISLPANREPEVTFVLPIKDVVAYKRTMQIAPHMPQPIFDGTYLAVSNSPQYQRPREPVALALGKCERSIVMRADVARIERRYGPELRTALAGAGLADLMALLPIDSNLSEFLEPLAASALQALDLGQQLDLSIEVEADRIDVTGALETRDAGTLAAWTSTDPVELAPFARSLVASDTMAFLGGCTPELFAQTLAELLGSSESQHERISRVLDSFSGLFSSLGAVSVSLGEGDSHVALHVRAAEDPGFARNLAATFELFSRNGMGVVVQSKSLSTISGVEVEDLLVHFDAASMCMLTGEPAADLPAVQARLDSVARSLFGAEAVRVRIANFGVHGLIAIGNDEAWFRRTVLWAKEGKDLTPPDVRSALAHLGSARSAAVLRLDLARLTQDRGEWARLWRALSEPARPSDRTGPVGLHAVNPDPLTVYLGAEGGTLRFGMTMGLSLGQQADAVRR